MSDLRQVFAALLPLLLSVGILVLGNGLFGTLLAVRMDLEGFPVGQIGLILASYSIGFIGGTMAGPKLVARVGHIRAFAALAALAAASPLIHAMVIDEAVWAALRILSGFCMACLFTIVESWINTRSANAVRGQVLSAYMTVNYLSYGGSQSLITAMDPGSFQMFSLVAILVALSLIPLALGRVESPSGVSGARLGPVSLFRISPLGVAACFGAGMINGAFGNLGPVYARAIDPDVAWVGQFMMIVVLSGFVLQFPMGKLSDRFDRRTVFLGTVAGITALAGALAVLDEAPFGILLPLFCLFGGLAYSVYPIGVAHANDFMRPEELVPASAGLLLMFGIGSVVGPVLAAWIMGGIGPSGLFAHIAAVGALLTLYTLYRMSRRQAKPLAEQGAFVALPVTSTPVALELSPRAEPEEDGQLSFDFAPAPAASPEPAEPPGDAQRA